MIAVAHGLAADDPFRGPRANLRRWQALALLFLAQMVGALYDASGIYQSSFRIFLPAMILAGLLILPVRGLGRLSMQDNRGMT